MNIINVIYFVIRTILQKVLEWYFVEDFLKENIISLHGCGLTILL